ncbi:MAG: hypothetical protein AUI16_11705 [Alphaproteobacteria bacterium 13_2_20CM_2_64_7]|jgi:hypothetical protein|nr:MAG: hypothetical protein AUI16_11705 [Alphaproteobacteria bacterium 13_2_20CM_2_64_7]
MAGKAEFMGELSRLCRNSIISSDEREAPLARNQMAVPAQAAPATWVSAIGQRAVFPMWPLLFLAD